MSYASRTNLALGGAIVSAVLAQAFPHFTVAWLVLGGLSSVVAVHAMFTKSEIFSDPIPTTDEVAVPTDSVNSQIRREVAQSEDGEVNPRDVMKPSSYRSLMACYAESLQQSRELDRLPIWTRTLAIRTEPLSADDPLAELQVQNSALSDLSRVGVLNALAAISGTLAVKRHVRSSMLDEQLVTWMRQIDESDHLGDQKRLVAAKKRSEARGVMVPDFCGSAMLH